MFNKNGFQKTMVVFLLIVLTTMCSWAETGVMTQPPIGYTKADETRAKQEANAKDKYLLELTKSMKDIPIMRALPAGSEYYVLDVVYNPQETSTWCGPAAIRQSLSFHKSKSASSKALPTQTVLAQKSGETGSGSWTDNLKTAINYYKTDYSFSMYATSDIIGQANPSAFITLQTRLRSCLMTRVSAPVVMIERGQFGGRYAAKTGRHYITVSGYQKNGATNVLDVKVVDPDWRSTYGGTYWEPLNESNPKSFYKAIYQADLDVGNKVMLY